jgi:hypothetical protein
LLEINTSKIKNTVTFTVDKESLKEAKDAIKSVKTFAESIEPALNMTKMKRQMKEVEAYAKRLQKQMPRYGEGNTPSPNSVPTPKQPTPPPKRPSSPGDKEHRRAMRREELGNLRVENFGYRASQFPKADIATLNQAKNIVEQTVALYKKEEVSLARLNQVMAHQLDTLRRSHREKVADVEEEVRNIRRVRREQEAQAKAQIRHRERLRKMQEREEKRERDSRRRDRERRFDRAREGITGLSPRLIASTLLGAGLFEGISRIREGLAAAAERTNLVSRGAQNVQTNPNAILTMRTWGELNGVDSANIIKAIDNIKDVRERLGNSAMMSQFDEKSGKWKGGDSGINDIMNQFGWTKDQIAQFQNRPLDFIQATVNEGQRRGMNSAQIGRLMENLGDDLMHYQRMFSDNGKEYIQTLNQLINSGAALTNEQIDAAQNYTKMATQFSLYGEGFSNNFLTGFMDAMKDSPDFAKNVDTFMQAAKGLGKATGDLANGIARVASWFIDFMNKYGPKDTTKEGIAQYYGTELKPGSESQYNMPWWPGGNPTEKNTSPLGMFNPLFLTEPLTPNPYSVANQGPNLASSMAQPNTQYPIPLQITNTLEIPAQAFQVNVVPDGYGFSNFLRSEMDASFSGYTRDLTLQINSGQSSTGG